MLEISVVYWEQRASRMRYAHYTINTRLVEFTTFEKEVSM